MNITLADLGIEGSNFTLSYNNGLINSNIENPRFGNNSPFNSSFLNNNYSEIKAYGDHYYLPDSVPVISREKSTSVVYYRDENTVFITDSYNLPYQQEPIFLY
jgi:hypothetical protein